MQKTVYEFTKEMLRLLKVKKITFQSKEEEIGSKGFEVFSSLVCLVDKMQCLMKLTCISIVVCFLNISAFSQVIERTDYFLNEANRFLVMSDYKKAENNFIRAIEFYQVKNNTEKMVECKFGIATIKYLEGNYKVAAELFESLRSNKSIALNEYQMEAIKSSITICKEFIKAPPLKN